MQLQGNLVRQIVELFRASDSASRASIIADIQKSLAAVEHTALEDMGTGQLTAADRSVLEARQAPIGELNSEQLAEFNAYLPWGALTLDPQGRAVGSAWNASKRSSFAKLVDDRHVQFDEVYPLSGKHVLEVGCFEAIHTLSCLSFGARVTGVDSRIENILKSVARLWAYGAYADIRHWDLESDVVPSLIPAEWDVLHHIGVLYHLSNPVQHLQAALARTREAVLLDTHVAADTEQASSNISVDGRSYAYYHYAEQPISPFAGMRDHAKWLLTEDLVALLGNAGFADVRVQHVRQERNGARALIWAFRSRQ